MNRKQSPSGGSEPALIALFKKYREVLLYCVFGGLTTVVSIASYTFFLRVLGVNVLIANVLSWVLSVLFAFFTNRKWVFDGSAEGSKGLLNQMLSFFGGRLFTLGVEEAILAVFVSWLKFDGVIVKVVAQVVIVVLNYFISKFWVFKKDTTES